MPFFPVLLKFLKAFSGTLHLLFLLKLYFTMKAPTAQLPSSIFHVNFAYWYWCFLAWKRSGSYRFWIALFFGFDIFLSCTLMIRLVKISTNKLIQIKVGSKFSLFALWYLKWRDETLNFIDLPFFVFFCQKKFSQNCANYLRNVSKALSNESNAKCNFLFNSMK